VRSRAVLALVGVGVGAYGVLRLLDLGLANLWATVQWLVGGVVLHDGVFAPLVIGLALVSLRVLPRRLLAPAAVALIVLVPVTLVGLPELGRFGADPRNATLLDRHYWMGWTALVVVVLVAVAVGTSVRRRPGSGVSER
jgi:hypothetical protein